MSTLMLLVRLSLFLLSMTGYILYVTQKYQIHIAFAPALFCAWISNLLFAGGILNILPQTAAAVWAGGCVFFVLACKRWLYPAEPASIMSDGMHGIKSALGKKQRTYMPEPVPAIKCRMCCSKRNAVIYAVFLFILFYFLCLLQGTHYTSYDNFSHWATVVKDMLLENRMPNFQDLIIRFQSYPLGSSLFIYYTCRIIGTSDACLLWAQALMLLSFLFCMAAFIKKRNLFGIFPSVLFGIWAFTVNNRIYELRVDTLLPLAGVAAFAVVYYYKKSPQRAIACASGLFMMLINIKNSGFYFYAVCALFMLVFGWKYCRQHKIYVCSAVFLLPLMVLFLWKRHVALVFPDGMGAKHSMSIENFESVFSKKTTEDILRIAGEMLGRFRSLDSVEVGMMLYLTIFFAVLIFVMLWKHRSVKKALRMLAAVWGCFLVYLVSVFGMYLFSMPLGEALRLASYERYILSVLIFLYGISVVFVMDLMAETAAAVFIKTDKGRLREQMIKCVSLAGVLFLLLCPVWQVRIKLADLYQKPDFSGTKRCELQQIMQREQLETGKSCFVYCHGTDDDARYLFYLSRYEFWSADIIVTNEKHFEENKDRISDCDYLIVWDSDEKMDRFLTQNGLGQYQGMEQAGIVLKRPVSIAR